MKASEVSVVLGKIATIALGGLWVDVVVKDYKFVYGRDRWLVTPVAGSREVWVEELTNIRVR